MPSWAASQKLDMFFRRIMRVPQLAREIACVPAVRKSTHDYSSDEQDERTWSEEEEKEDAPVRTTPSGTMSREPMRDEMSKP